MHEDPCLRVRALGALARRGDGASLRSLVEAAESAADGGVRAEAIRRLGALDAARNHFHIFERALQAPHAPAIEQAAIALGAVFGVEALAALLRGHLLTKSEQAAGAIENAMAVAMEDVAGPARSAAERREEMLARDAGVTAGWVPFGGREVVAGV
jgi:HEAT repeat protein